MSVTTRNSASPRSDRDARLCVAVQTLPAAVARDPHDPAARLSPGELRVARLLDTDLSQRQIGAELFLSRNTIHTHMRSIYRKLDVHARAEAVERVRGLGPFF